ncbi:ferric reductase-like transmembrane domain-containing protein [Kineosporia sp. J2-2]|uniref:Ferric reductase-like transmembrane domain-containing protein n=1 Tax=Kineosporia corallincola TaxID=2835133 RepID=A0ABS5TQP0_9ACTN|nr:ferric reductase-like transmembrane domain-containing protein [Kineosporia corallincola]MBT0772616.1 ferric reductase-like transmembrane domain-containing protein [Kineosporia corallincola]
MSLDFLTEAFQDDRLLWFLNRGTGVILLVLMTASVALGVLSTVRASSVFWPRFVTQGLHRNISLLCVALLIAHAALAVIDEFVNIRWFDMVVPFVGEYQPLWLGLGTLATDFVILTVITGLSRTRFGSRSWRTIHLTSYLGWLAGLVHGFGIGTDSREVWSMGVTVACVGVVAGAVAVRLGTLGTERRMDRRQSSPGRRAR